MQTPTWTVLLLVACLAGCSHLEPKRTAWATQGEAPNCTAANGVAPPACANQIIEYADSYQLHFAEFDDQGRPYGTHPSFGEAHRQVELFLTNVNQHVATSEAGVSVVVFVHGWLHSSASDDSNLESFRRVLDQLAQVEQYAFCRRQVIGLYVAWRGSGTVFEAHPADTLTFWSRKRAAEEVAAGSFQHIVAGLKAMQTATPDRSVQARSPSDPDCSSRLKTTYVGHSFGGLVVMSAMTQGLTRELMVDQMKSPSSSMAPTAQHLPQGPDEVIIAINPAIEGARFDSLFRVALRNNYPIYRSPRFVAITTRDDWATGMAFPVGRGVSQFFKRYPRGDKKGRDAAITTVGHDSQYLTRSLLDSSQYEGTAPLPHFCADAEPTDPMEVRARKDVDRMKAFHASVGGQYDANQPAHWPRLFCVKHKIGSATDTGILVMDDGGEARMNRNTPVWNISTSKPIVESHGDIENVRLVEFLRQIYVDSMFFRSPM